MFEHLKITGIKALKEATLFNLGKINVVCGKNNSGKTTLLEGITNNKKRVFGQTFKKEIIDLIIKKTSGQIYEWHGNSGSRFDGSVGYEKALCDVITNKPIWFENEFEEFIQQVNEKLKLHYAANNVSVDKEPLQNAFFEILTTVPVLDFSDRVIAAFLDKTIIILLPPKRSLELDTLVERHGEAQSNGNGILNYLFYARSQNDKSPERAFYNQMLKAFTYISSGFKFDVNMLPKEASTQTKLVLNFAYENGNWITANDCGMGLQDLMVILFFALYSEYPVLLMEEPENHLHPEMQRKLLRFLREETDKQYFLSTHSNIFLNNAYVDRVFYTRFVDGEVKVDDATSKASILDDLGYSVADNLVSDLVILVEGPKDVPIIEEFNKKLGLDAKYNIKAWPLGGDIMDQVDLTVFTQGYKILALVDNDPNSNKVRNRFVKKCSEHGIEVVRLERYAIENYFSINALKTVFHSQFPDTISSIENDKPLEEQIGINVKNNNRKLAQAMTLDEIEGTDLHDFFMKVKEMCEQK